MSKEAERHLEKWHRKNGSHKRFGDDTGLFYHSEDCINYRNDLQQRYNEAIEALKELVTEFSQPDYEIWCDHPVGICACDVIRKMDKAKKIINNSK